MRSALAMPFIMAALGSSCTPIGDATIELRLIDAPPDDVKQVVVSIASVEAHVQSGWITLTNKPFQIDLLRLQNGAFYSLGLAKLPPGKVGQIRLILQKDAADYIVDKDGINHPLTVPSGEQTGIKLVGGFNVPACGVGHVTIDFDGKKSLQVHAKGNGAGDEWIMRPVVRIHTVSIKSGPCGPNDATADAAYVPTSNDPCALATCPESQACGVNGTCDALLADE